MRIPSLFLITVSAIGGCAGPRPAGPADTGFPAVSFLREHDGVTLGEPILVPRANAAASQPSGRQSLPFRSDLRWQYVLHYCRDGNACPDGQLEADCAHFQAHALAAGGILVAHPTAVCHGGLALRVKDLAIAFDNASRRYENVTKFTDYRLARRGDYCFLPRLGAGTHDHLMLLAQTPDPTGALVYSHTNNRAAGHAPFDPTRCLFYRIEDR